MEPPWDRHDSCVGSRSIRTARGWVGRCHPPRSPCATGRSCRPDRSPRLIHRRARRERMTYRRFADASVDLLSVEVHVRASTRPQPKSKPQITWTTPSIWPGWPKWRACRRITSTASTARCRDRPPPTIRGLPPIRVAALAHRGDYLKIGSTFERSLTARRAAGSRVHHAP